MPLQLIAGNNGYWFNHSFQSLFYWKYYFNPSGSVDPPVVMVFQSLFYWKYHFNLDLIAQKN